MEKWWNIAEKSPPYGVEVLVRVDGHRGPAWANTYCLVAYLSEYNDKWYEERHDEKEILGVIQWRFIPGDGA